MEKKIKVWSLVLLIGIGMAFILGVVLFAMLPTLIYGFSYYLINFDDIVTITVYIGAVLAFWVLFEMFLLALELFLGKQKKDKYPKRFYRIALCCLCGAIDLAVLYFQTQAVTLAIGGVILLLSMTWSILNAQIFQANNNKNV